MAKFTHFFVYGNGGDGWDVQKFIKWGKTTPKKFNMDLVFSGVSYGTTEDFLVVLKGSVNDFEKLYTVEDAPPISDRRTTFGGSMQQQIS
jgi:hypothetical protein